MLTFLAQAVASWRTQGLELLPGIDSLRIEELAQKHNVKLTEDARHLYNLCGGMGPDVEDQACFALWPLERALAESVTFPPGLLPFAEGLISSHLYLLRWESADISSVHVDYEYTGKTIQCVAESLEVAFMYLGRSPSRLLLPQ
jgi:hypothetical protein